MENKNASTSPKEDIIEGIKQAVALENHIKQRVTLLKSKLSMENEEIDVINALIKEEQSKEINSSTNKRGIGENKEQIKELIQKRDEHKEKVNKILDKQANVLKILGMVEDNRRYLMRKIRIETEDSEQVWCSLKHAFAQEISLYDSYRGGSDTFDNWQKAVEITNNLLSEFIGEEITECSACLHDMLK